MFRTLMKSKIHRATVTRTNLNYVGSITIDENLLSASGIVENELVQIVNISTGGRFDTYVIPGESGSGCIELNGAAARLAEPGDLVIIMSYALMNDEEVKTHKPVVVMVDNENRVLEHIDNEAIHNQMLAAK
jgi:aspartate 1-decarboxylase